MQPRFSTDLRFRKFFREKHDFTPNLYKTFQTHLIIVVMKRLKFILGAAALAAVAMTASPVINAQENGNRDEYGKVVRGPYETNRFGDNWFVGAGGGVNMYLDNDIKTNIGIAVDANLGKCFTPSVGMRVGYSGIDARYEGDQQFDFMYFHGDFLWNISNALSGYKETRFWDFVPYLHAGYFRSYDIGGNTDMSDNQFAAGAGLLHGLRLTERLDLNVDMRATVLDATARGSSGVSVLPAVTMGLAVNLGYPAFTRTSTIVAGLELAAADQIAALEAATVALEIANAALANENENLADANAVLKNQVNNMKKQKPAPAAVDAFEGMDAPKVYFAIGKTTLSVDELAHLEFIAKNIIANADKDGMIYLTVMGSADSNTGTQKRNQQLSEARGKYVADLLTSKYGIPKERLVVKSEVIKAKADPELDRAVAISF